MRILFQLFFLFLAHNLIAQGFQVNFQGQKQQGMGCAGTALPRDASSLFYNPGSAVFLNENSVIVGGTPVFANVLFIDSASNGAYRTNSPIGTPFSIYGMFQAKSSAKLKFGIAINTPFGSTIQYEDGWIGRFALTRLSLKAIFIQPTFAYRISDNIGIGGGLVISKGSVNLQKDIPLQDANGVYSHAELAGKAIGLGYNFGIHLKANAKLNIGIDYRSKINMKVNNGEVTFNVPNSLSANFPNGNFTSSLPLPSVLTIGAALRLNKLLTVVVDVNAVGWKVYDTLSFDYKQNTSSLSDTKSARCYKNTFAFRGGMEWVALRCYSKSSSKEIMTEDAVVTKIPNHELLVRFGGGFGISPVQNGYVTPETPDANRSYGTIGLGYNFNQKTGIDLSLYYTKVKRADTNIETQISGTYTTIAWCPGISFYYRW
jgi:long-chain fatty acid transport protein